MRGATDAAKPKLDGLVLEELEQLADFLEPFQVHTDRLQGQDYPTLPYVEPAFESLLTHLGTIHETDCESLATVRQNAYILLLQKITIKMEHKIARFLWPKMKHLPDYTDEERAKVKLLCASLFRNVTLLKRVIVTGARSCPCAVPRFRSPPWPQRRPRRRRPPPPAPVPHGVHVHSGRGGR